MTIKFPMGRPPKFTSGSRKRAIEATLIGATRDIAAQYSGVQTATLYGWLARGRREIDTEYSQFFDDMKMAEAQCAVKCLALVQQAATTNWHAAAWLLERRHQYTKDPQPQIEVETDGESISVNQLLEEIQTTDSLLMLLDGPVIDLDD